MFVLPVINRPEQLPSENKTLAAANIQYITKLMTLFGVIL